MKLLKLKQEASRMNFPIFNPEDSKLLTKGLMKSLDTMIKSLKSKQFMDYIDRIGKIK